MDSSHADSCKIGQPPNSLLISDSNVSTPSVSMASSSIQDAYKRRAFVIAFGSTVSLDGDDERRSVNKMKANQEPVAYLTSNRIIHFRFCFVQYVLFTHWKCGTEFLEYLVTEAPYQQIVFRYF